MQIDKNGDECLVKEEKNGISDVSQVLLVRYGFYVDASDVLFLNISACSDNANTAFSNLSAWESVD